MLSADYFAEKCFVLENIFIGAEETLFGETQAIHICFNTNKGYFCQLGVTITSILETNKEKNFVFHIFIDERAKDEEERIKKLADKYHQNFYFHIMNMEQFEGFHVLRQNMAHVTYFRLYMPKVMKKFADKYLYIDADMLCLGKLESIEQIDFQGHPVAVVEDLPSTSASQCRNLNLKNNKYFNSGMLWINVMEWERLQITEKSFVYSNNRIKGFVFHDQDILNLVIDGNAVFLPEQYNYLVIMSRELGGIDKTACGNILLCHFAGVVKPWQLCLTKYDKLWRACCNKSLWQCPPDFLQNKQPRNYKKYKLAAQYSRDINEYFQAFKFYWLYAILKIKFVMQK